MPLISLLAFLAVSEADDYLSSGGQWTQQKQTNCYTGHGAADLESPTGSSSGKMSVSECQNLCDNTAGCTGITVGVGAGDVECYRRSTIQLSRCAADSASDTWTKAQWMQRRGKNCYTGHGATDLESPTGSSCGTMSVSACQAFCDDTAGCTGVTVGVGAGDVACYRRSDIEPSQCAVDSGADTWTKAVVPSPPPVPRPAPGLDDVCADMDEASKCSPEICSMKPHAQVELEAKTYYQDRSILLPVGSRLVGAGINKTYIVSCGAPSSGRRGFILNSDTYLGHFTWQGLQASRGNFDSAIGTPGCLLSNCDPSGGCIPEGGDCTGVSNAVAEHIHVRPYAHLDAMWPLSTSAGWFPKTLPWGPDSLTGSRNITVRGIISWGTWADGINFHGGHHDVLIEQCEMSYTGDDPYGLWPDSSEAIAAESNCQQNIVLRNNVARWPRYQGGQRAGEKGPRDTPECNKVCYATYAGGSGIQWVNNHCEGATMVLFFFDNYPGPPTKWCGTLAVAGNTYAEMAGETGCRAEDSTDWCYGSPDSGTIGGQCNTDETPLPPRCEDDPRFSSCESSAGIGGICHNAEGSVLCLTATELAEGGQDVCKGYERKCTIFGLKSSPRAQSDRANGTEVFV